MVLKLSQDADRKAKARGFWRSPSLPAAAFSHSLQPWGGTGVEAPERAAMAKEKGSDSFSAFVLCFPPQGPGRLLEKISPVPVMVCGGSPSLPWVPGPPPYSCSLGANQNIELGPVRCNLQRPRGCAGIDMEDGRKVGWPFLWAVASAALDSNSSSVPTGCFASGGSLNVLGVAICLSIDIDI